MLARRLGSTSWPALAKPKSPWKRAALGVYVSVPGPGQPGGVRVIELTQDGRLAWRILGNAAVYGRPAAGPDGRIDLYGTGSPPALPGVGAGNAAPVGRYVTSPGDVAASPESTWPFAPTLNGYSAVAGGLHLRNRTDAGGVGRMTLTNLRTGAAVDWAGAYPLGQGWVLSTGDAVFHIRSVTAGAGPSVTGTTVPADGRRPQRLRYARQVYDDAPVSPALRGVDGQQPAASYPFRFQRPPTTGTVGRGVACSLVAPVVRAHEAVLPHGTETYEHEIGSATGGGVTASGATYATAVITHLRTRRWGFLRVSRAGVRFVDLYATVERRESDVWLWNADDGTAEGTLTYPDPNRVNALVGTTVLTDTLAPDARDVAGLAKGAAGWEAGTAMPGVAAQGRLLAVTRSHVDRYDYEGRYLGRVPCPAGVSAGVGQTALSNLRWLHTPSAETQQAGGSGVPFYLAAGDALGLPGPQSTYLVSQDAGATWSGYVLSVGTGGLPIAGQPYMNTWSGMIPLFPT